MKFRHYATPTPSVEGTHRLFTMKPDRRNTLIRSWLIAPANVERRARKSLNCGADAAVLDLEDAVAITEKSTARQLAVQRLRESRTAWGYVRINAYEEGCYHDLMEVVGPWLDGILVPKAEDASSLLAIDWALRQLESHHGMAPGSVDMVPIIETCAGVMNIASIARATTRISRLAFGGGDFTRDMGIAWTRDEAEVHEARLQTVMASRAAGLAKPIDTVFIHLDDDEGLHASVQRGVQLGFGSKSCIHPQQLQAIHAGLAPSAEAVADAQRVVDAFSQAEAAGSAAIRLDGRLVDYANAQSAKDLLVLHEQHRLADRRHY